MPTTVPDGAKTISLPDAAAFETWLEHHVDHAPGAWLTIAEKSSGIASQRDADVPPDLADALAANPRAAQAIEVLGRTDRYAVILELETARTPENRTTRLDRAVASLES